VEVVAAGCSCEGYCRGNKGKAIVEEVIFIFTVARFLYILGSLLRKMPIISTKKYWYLN
jgi:hypothetical protein